MASSDLDFPREKKKKIKKLPRLGTSYVLLGFFSIFFSSKGKAVLYILHSIIAVFIRIAKVSISNAFAYFSIIKLAPATLK